VFWEKSFEVGGLLEQPEGRDSSLFGERAETVARSDPDRLTLPGVTLCAISSVNLPATIAALRASLDQIDFAECLLFTDQPVRISGTGIRKVQIPRITSSRDYSSFVLNGLVDHVRSEHCLIVQWDGFVLDAAQWRSDFLDFDYVGAPWPKWGDGEDVGNGGFSLRSRRLLEACRDPQFVERHPEDVAICRVNRRLLEIKHGLKFADRSTAEHFAFERSIPTGRTFGFHGIFNMVQALGVDRFWEIYSALDDRRTAFVDYWLLMRQLGGSRTSLGRKARLTLDRMSGLLTS
jgi:hypothetical protein